MRFIGLWSIVEFITNLIPSEVLQPIKLEEIWYQFYTIQCITFIYFDNHLFGEVDKEEGDMVFEIMQIGLLLLSWIGISAKN